MSIKFNHFTIVKSSGLLPMEYKVREIATELNIPNRTLRDWLTKGAPHHRDNRNHIWIIGTELKEWIMANRKKRRGQKMLDTEGYCFRCKKPVELLNPKIIPRKGKLINIRGKCEKCGCSICRGGRVGQSK